MSEIIKAEDFGLEPTQAEKIALSFAPKISEREGYAKMYNELITKELCPEVYEEARILKNKLAKVRTGIAAIHKAEKAYFLASGKFVDAWKNKETLPITQMEDKLVQIAKHEEIELAKKRLKKQLEREEELSKYVESYPSGLGEMDESVYQSFKKGLIADYNERIEQEKKIEAERIAKEKAEAAERERIKKENERLKAEAEAAEKIRLEEEKKRKEEEEKRLEIEAKEKAKQEAILQKEREEKAKIEAELKAKKEAEDLAIKEKKEAEKAEAAAKRKSELAPEKDKIENWIKSFDIENINIETFSEDGKITCNDVKEKFESFKKWALNKIKNIK